MIKTSHFPRLRKISNFRCQISRQFLTFSFNIFLTLPIFAQKISVQFTMPPSSTPSVSKAVLKYNKDFAYSFTFDDATIDAFTTGLPILRGGLVRGNDVTYTGLFYTDGCGNSVPFTAAIAWNTGNQFGIDVHTGNVIDQLRWGQLDTLYDAGWDVINHSYSHKSRWLYPMSNNEYINEVEQNNIAVRNKTRRRLEMPVFAVPANDDYYHGYAFNLGHKLILDQSASTIGYGGLRVDTLQNLYALKVHRMSLNDTYKKIVPQFLDSVALKSKNGVKMWFNEFAHRVDDFSLSSSDYNFYYFKSRLESMANQYGRGGQDRLWMASPQEVYEYLVMRQMANFTTQVVGNQLDINFDLRLIPSWLRRKTLTLVVNSTADFNRVDVPLGVKMTFKGIGNQKIINLDFTNFKVGINDVKTGPSVLRLFPNPAKNILSVECATGVNAPLRATIFDVSGKLIYQKNVDYPTFQVSIQDLPNGLYFLMVRQGERIFREKFVKQ